MAQLKVGDKAPAFKLKDQDGRTVSLADFKGSKLLLYFYPKADTPGCTTQACSVRDAMQELAEAGAVPVGISPDEPARQKKFDGKYDLGFPLLSDPDHQVAQAYGAWGEKSMYGKKYQGIIRSSFLIDETGRILQVSYKIKPQDTVPNAREALVWGARPGMSRLVPLAAISGRVAVATSQPRRSPPAASTGISNRSETASYQIVVTGALVSPAGFFGPACRKVLACDVPSAIEFCCM